MARDVQEDFEELRDFVRDYGLEQHVSDQKFVSLLSRQHKKYHGVLTLLAETHHQSWKAVDDSSEGGDALNVVWQERLDEFASDLGTAMFVWIHGAYKGARLLLRSAIENLVKAVGVVSHPEVVTVRNAYEVFELARQQPFFDVPANARRFELLRGDYSTLSRDVHTSTLEEMEQVAALSFFPRFSNDEAEEFADLYVRCATTGAELVCLMFPRLYHSMHHRNRDIVNVCLGAACRAELHRESGEPEQTQP